MTFPRPIMCGQVTQFILAVTTVFQTSSPSVDTGYRLIMITPWQNQDGKTYYLNDPEPLNCNSNHYAYKPLYGDGGEVCKLCPSDTCIPFDRHSLRECLPTADTIKFTCLMYRLFAWTETGSSLKFNSTASVHEHCLNSQSTTDHMPINSTLEGKKDQDLVDEEVFDQNDTASSQSTTEQMEPEDKCTRSPNNEVDWWGDIIQISLCILSGFINFQSTNDFVSKSTTNRKCIIIIRVVLSVTLSLVPFSAFLAKRECNTTILAFIVIHSHSLPFVRKCLIKLYQWCANLIGQNASSANIDQNDEQEITSLTTKDERLNEIQTESHGVLIDKDIDKEKTVKSERQRLGKGEPPY